MKWVAIGGAAVLVVMALGVGWFVQSCAADKQDAERTVSQLYEALNRDDYEAAFALYHPDSWFRLTEAEMLSKIEYIDKDLGQREEGRLVGWHVQKGSEAWVDLTYENVYERRHTVETFRLVRVSGDYRVLVHNFDIVSVR